MSLMCVAVVGGALATAGSRATWFVVSERSAAVSIPGQGTFRFPARVVHLSGGDLSSAVTGTALLLLIFSGLGFLVGPRARAVLLVAIMAGSGVLIWVSARPSRSDAITAALQTKRFSTAHPEVRDGAGRAISIAGAAAAGVTALVAFPLAARVGKVRMPESGPEER